MNDTTSEYALTSYDYTLPKERIAQQPATPRDSARLMVLHRATGEIEHAVFREIGRFLRSGDLLVLNDTRVFPARTLGLRSTGGKVEVLFLQELDAGTWECLLRCHGRVRPGEQLQLEDNRLAIRMGERMPNGHWRAVLPRGVDLLERLAEIGRVPLPPYIERAPDHQRDAEDRDRYQTVYAHEAGAVAAPTAGLHFTEGLLGELEAQGIRTTRITLHVGVGTFQPIRNDDIRRHQMHAEAYTISEASAEAVRAAKAEGRRVIAVGTTACRALEASAASPDGFAARSGWTRIYIYPSYTFRIVDALLTNFHLPRSTLLALVAAFAGRERILSAYETAVREGYRFYSYGDAMLIE